MVQITFFKIATEGSPSELEFTTREVISWDISDRELIGDNLFIQEPQGATVKLYLNDNVQGILDMIHDSDRFTRQVNIEVGDLESNDYITVPRNEETNVAKVSMIILKQGIPNWIHYKGWVEVDRIKVNYKEQTVEISAIDCQMLYRMILEDAKINMARASQHPVGTSPYFNASQLLRVLAGQTVMLGGTDERSLQYEVGVDDQPLVDVSDLWNGVESVIPPEYTDVLGFPIETNLFRWEFNATNIHSEDKNVFTPFKEDKWQLSNYWRWVQGFSVSNIYATRWTLHTTQAVDRAGFVETDNDIEFRYHRQFILKAQYVIPSSYNWKYWIKMTLSRIIRISNGIVIDDNVETNLETDRTSALQWNENPFTFDDYSELEQHIVRDNEIYTRISTAGYFGNINPIGNASVTVHYSGNLTLDHYNCGEQSLPALDVLRLVLFTCNLRCYADTGASYSAIGKIRFSPRGNYRPETTEVDAYQVTGNIYQGGLFIADESGDLRRGLRMTSAHWSGTATILSLSKVSGEDSIYMVIIDRNLNPDTAEWFDIDIQYSQGVDHILPTEDWMIEKTSERIFFNPYDSKPILDMLYYSDFRLQSMFNSIYEEILRSNTNVIEITMHKGDEILFYNADIGQTVRYDDKAWVIVRISYESEALRRFLLWQVQTEEIPEPAGCPIPIRPSVGDGSEGSPYEISTANHLMWLSLNDDPEVPDMWEKHYIQTADIDAYNIRYCDDGKGWNPPEMFEGSYDGQGFKISNLFIDQHEEANGFAGLFQWLDSDAIVKNVKLRDVDFYGSRASGGICAEDFSNAQIQNCSVTGTIRTSGWHPVGGLIGEGASQIEKCWADVIITYDDACYDRCGGLIAYLRAGGKCLDSYARGVINAGQYSTQVGGLIGTINNAEVKRSYAAVEINAPDGSNIGGFLGRILAGSTTEVFENNYWDTQVSGQANSAGEGVGEIEGKTTAEMKQQATYTDWDFVNAWDIDPLINDGYPHLQEA